MSRLIVNKLDGLNTLVIRQVGREFFIATNEAIVIDIPSLSFLLKFLVVNNFLSQKVLEGILDEARETKNAK